MCLRLSKAGLDTAAASICEHFLQGTSFLQGSLERLPVLFIPHILLMCHRYSVWVDSKLRLNADPLYILQRFLIDQKAEFSISQHYHRRCVWEEVRGGPESQQTRHKSTRLVFATACKI